MTGTHTQNPIYSRYRNSYSDPYILQIQEYTQNPINSRYMNSYSEPYILQVQEYILRTLYTPGTGTYTQTEPYILQVQKLILRTLYTPDTGVYSEPYILQVQELEPYTLQVRQNFIFIMWNLEKLISRTVRSTFLTNICKIYAVQQRPQEFIFMHLAFYLIQSLWGSIL